MNLYTLPKIDVFAEFPVPPIARDMLPAALHDDLQIQPMKYEKGWTESARLWCAVVGAPSVKKTHSIKRATQCTTHCSV